MSRQDEAVVDLYHADCIEGMKRLPDASVDAVVCDPPYFIRFLNRAWDHQPSPVEWHRAWAAEALRVAKPGTMLLAFGARKTHHRLMTGLELGGWEIVDCLSWWYAQGLVTAKSASKLLAKAGATPEEIAHWDGWYSVLKPASEMIPMARKPLDGTMVANLRKHGTGFLNIDACRIARGGRPMCEGSWPSDVILVCYCDGDEHEPGCPVRILDEQSGITSTKRIEKPSDCGGRTWSGTLQIRRGPRGYTDTGGASRFFYVAKASPTERGLHNEHDTVKPLALMDYLVRLVTPPGGTVLDPFLGSGTTAISCARQGFRCIGIDNDAESIQTAIRRLDEWRAKSGTP